MPRGWLLSWGLVAWLVRGAETDSMSDQSLCFQGRGGPLRTGRGDSELLSLLGPWPWARASPFSKAESPGERGPKRREAPGGPRWEAMNLHPHRGDAVGARRVHVRVSESKGKKKREARGERGENRAKAVSTTSRWRAPEQGFRVSEPARGCLIIPGSAGTCRRRGAACSDTPAGRLAAAAGESEPCHPGVRRARVPQPVGRVCAGSGEPVPAAPGLGRLASLRAPGRGPVPPPNPRPSFASPGRGEPRAGRPAAQSGRSQEAAGSKRAAAQARVGPRRGAGPWRSRTAAGGRTPRPRPGCGAEEPVAGEARPAAARGPRALQTPGRGLRERPAAPRGPRGMPRSAPAF